MISSRQLSRWSLRSSLSILFLIALAIVTASTNMFLASQLPLFLNNSTFLIRPSSHRVPAVSAVNASFHRSIRLSDNDHDDMLHIVTTRFMQDQSDLLDLGWARLELFETFCLPTMIPQQATNFLWFVMTDPKLDADLLQRLRSLLSPYPHFYLIASNTAVLMPQNLAVGSTTRDNLILTGDIDLLYMKMFDLHRPLLVATRLDADDGLHKTTLLEIQRVARQLPVDSRGWQVICAGIHFEWRNDDIGASGVIGAGEDISTKQEMDHMTSGKLRVVKEAICVTPGYTLIKHRKADSIEFSPWPRIGHQQMTADWPECGISRDVSTLVNVTTTNSLNKTSGNIDKGSADYGGAGNDVPTYNCWKKLKFYPAALRPRTITSAGMNRVRSGPTNIFDNQTGLFWGYVQRDFGIQADRALSTSRYLHEHFMGIVADNLKGQW
jgi:hypothetical protein